MIQSSSLMCSGIHRPLPAAWHFLNTCINRPARCLLPTPLTAFNSGMEKTVEMV